MITAVDELLLAVYRGPAPSKAALGTEPLLTWEQLCESFGLDGIALGIDRQFALAAIGGSGEEGGEEVSSWCFLRFRKLTDEKVRAIRSAMAMVDPLDSDDDPIDCGRAIRSAPSRGIVC